MRTAIILLLLLPAAASAQVIEQVDIIRRGTYRVISPDTTTVHYSSEQALEGYLNQLLSGVPADSIRLEQPFYEIEPTYHPYARIQNLLLYDLRYLYDQDLELQQNIIRISAASAADSVSITYSSAAFEITHALEGGAIADSIITDYQGLIMITAEGFKGSYSHREQISIDTALLNSF